MAVIVVSLDGSTERGGTPILLHNERLSDPLDPFTKAKAAISSKRKKAEADLLEIARIEWEGAMYHNADEPIGPCVPSNNIVRMIQEAAKRHKQGVNVLRGIIPIVDRVPILYDGPRGMEEMWKAGTFALRKGVGINGRRIHTTRPCFYDWKVECELELDLSILNADSVDQFVFEAGKYVGLCDNRPQHGRFFGMARLKDEKLIAVSENGKAKKEAVLA